MSSRDQKHRDERDLLERLRLLQQPLLGPFKKDVSRSAALDEPSLDGRLVKSRPYRTSGGGSTLFDFRAYGAGFSTDRVNATIKALAEAVERLSAHLVGSRRVRVASAQELGSTAVDLMRFPQCSETEREKYTLALPIPSFSHRMRWVECLSLLNGAVQWIPLNSVFLAPAKFRGERSFLSISTGCAAATTLHQAIVSGILEVIERDALTIAWIQRLALPRMTYEDSGAWTDRLPFPAWSGENLRFSLFDATTDLGIPCVYALRESHERNLANIVGCACSLDVGAAARKALIETCAVAVWLRKKRLEVTASEECLKIEHGPLLMAQRSMSHAFDFLTTQPHSRSLSLSECERRYGTRPGARIEEDLYFLVERLRRQALSCYVVDLTSPEAACVGMHVVKVIIPDLMPFSYIHPARFLAHPRLYNAPLAMGFKSCAEPDLNPFPQPFG